MICFQEIEKLDAKIKGLEEKIQEKHRKSGTSSSSELSEKNVAKHNRKTGGGSGRRDSGAGRALTERSREGSVSVFSDVCERFLSNICCCWCIVLFLKAFFYILREFPEHKAAQKVVGGGATQI